MALMWMPGPSEWLLILVVVLLLFGATRVPQLMRGMGQGVREFKEALKGDKDDAAQAASQREGEHDAASGSAKKEG
jgi:sec-independent protein translocase protein TatA